MKSEPSSSKPPVGLGGYESNCTRYFSSAVVRPEMRACVSARRACNVILPQMGISAATRMQMMRITTSSSMSVNPAQRERAWTGREDIGESILLTKDEERRSLLHIIVDFRP